MAETTVDAYGFHVPLFPNVATLAKIINKTTNTTVKSWLAYYGCYPNPAFEINERPGSRSSILLPDEHREFSPKWEELFTVATPVLPEYGNGNINNYRFICKFSI
jgi:hypothetical protein